LYDYERAALIKRGVIARITWASPWTAPVQLRGVDCGDLTEIYEIDQDLRVRSRIEFASLKGIGNTSLQFPHIRAVHEHQLDQLLVVADTNDYLVTRACKQLPVQSRVLSIHNIYAEERSRAPTSVLSGTPNVPRAIQG
jgi:hypothetical protein